MSNRRKLELLKELKIRKSRTSLKHFTQYTFPKYKPNWFTDQLDYELDLFYSNTMAGRQPRTMIFAPPRHGKSEKFSRRFPAYAFGRNPDLNMIATSYGATLAQKMNRDVQRIIDTDRYSDIFPNTQINSKRVRTVNSALRNNDEFEIIGRTGGYKCAGVGGGITGMGSDIGIIDDPFKDQKSARSATVRESIYNWYCSDFYTRLSEYSGVLLGHTRWHVDDLAGRLIKEMENGGESWRIVNFPAVAEHDEWFCMYSDGLTDYGMREIMCGEKPIERVLLRKKGEALCPQRYSSERLERIRTATMHAGVWDSLYQQKPLVKGGDMFKSAWFKYYTFIPQFDYRYVTVDTAQKTGEANDYTVFQHWGVADNKAYLIDQYRKKLTAPDLRDKAKSFWEKCKGYFSGSLRAMYVEDKSSGTGLIQELQKVGGIPVIPIPRTKDKVTRAYDAIPWIQSGNVLFPETAIWMLDFEDELTSFAPDDSHLHDDQVDAMMDGIEIAFGSPPSMFDDGAM